MDRCLPERILNCQKKERVFRGKEKEGRGLEKHFTSPKRPRALNIKW